MKVLRYLALLCLLSHSVAFAQQAPDSVEAKKAQASVHFRRGVELFQEQAFSAALVEFQRAYDVLPDARLLYNIALAQLETHDYLGAAQNYERYLLEGGDDITKERRATVESALAALKERVGSIEVMVNKRNAEVFIDDVSVGKTPLSAPVRVNVGRHRVAAVSEAGTTDAEIIDVAGGDVAQVSLTLIDKLVSAGEKKVVWNTAQRTALGLWIAGAAALAAGGGTALMAKSSQDDLDKLLETRDVRRSKLSSQQDEVQRRAITTDVLIATGAAAAIAGTLTWVLGRPSKEERAKDEPKPVAKLRWDVGLGSVGLSGAF